MALQDLTAELVMRRAFDEDAEALRITGTLGVDPTGLATQANQVIGNDFLESIDDKIVAVDTGAVVISSSALPSGASTAAKQDTSNTSLASIDGKITAVNTGAVVVASSALPTGAATEAKQDTGNTSLASIDGKIVAVNTGAVVISSGSIAVNNASGASAVNIQDGGNSITVDGSVTATVSGTVAATQSGTWNITNISGTVSLPTGAATETTLSSLNSKVTAVNTGAVVVSSSALPSGAATSALQTQPGVDIGDVTINNASGGAAVNIQDGGNSITVDGTVTANAGTNLNTSALALETGGNLASIKTNTDNLSLAQNSTTSGQVGNLILTATTTAAPSYTTAKSNPLSTTTTGALRIDGSAVTQPVSGTITQGGKTALTKATNDYTSTAVTTAAYVQLIADTGGTAATEIEIFDSSGEVLFLALGAGASEVDKIYIVPGGNGRVPLSIPANSRVSVKAVTATASVGRLIVNVYG